MPIVPEKKAPRVRNKNNKTCRELLLRVGEENIMQVKFENT
jgi:hypothetical protein